MMPLSKANDLSRILRGMAAVLLIQSCSAVPPGGTGIGRIDDRGGSPKPAVAEGGRTVIRGKVRIDFPEYRVRGSCRIVSEPGGAASIDFIHSSLFGSFREDVTVYIDSLGIFIHDHEREEVWPADSTLALLKRQADFDVRPDDLLFILLLAVPEVTGARNEAAGDENGGWRTSGTWRGRDVELSGDRKCGIRSFRQCMKDASLCYTAKYVYCDGGRYPCRVVLERDPGGERISLTVSGVEEETAGE